MADEPTTALDVTIQTQIIALLREINQKQNNAMLFITHDLNLARKICHRIAVMKDGCVVEQGETESVFEHPAQEYTRRLIEAVSSRMKKHRAVTVPPKKDTVFGGTERTKEAGHIDEAVQTTSLSPVVQVKTYPYFIRTGITASLPASDIIEWCRGLTFPSIPAKAWDWWGERLRQDLAFQGDSGDEQRY